MRLLFRLKGAAMQEKVCPHTFILDPTMRSINRVSQMGEFSKKLLKSRDYGARSCATPSVARFAAKGGIGSDSDALH